MDTAQKMHNLLELLGNIDEPLGISYAKEAPANALTPAGEGHCCIINYARKARTQKQPAYFSAQVQGCPGGWMYMGFSMSAQDRIANFVSTGWPGQEGERYMPSPASMQRFFTAMDMQTAPAPYCVLKPFSLFSTDDTPMLVSFTCRAEALTGLCQLAVFALDDFDAVTMPFGAGCTNILSWPFFYQRRGLPKAVLGGADPSCRPFMPVDALSFTVSYDVMLTMLDAVPRSFLTGKTWAGVRKRIEKSHKTWNLPS